MNIMGISCYFHDAAATLLVDGHLVAAAAEERFSRCKHDFSFPRNAIAFCLQRGQLKPGDLDYVVFYEKPFLKFERMLLTCLHSYPRAHKLFRDTMTNWFLDKMWIKNAIRTELEIAPEKVLFSEHHLSHAASTFFASPFDRAAILTVDGVGEWTTTATWVGQGNQIRPLAELRFPHSLGLLYSAFTAFLGFDVNEGEFKVMGLAPYGKPRYVDRVLKLLDLEEDGSFELNLDYFCHHYSTESLFSRQFQRLFGPPRDRRQSENIDPYYADVAASLQWVLEETLLRTVRNLHRQTGLTRLCMAGGVALNSVANGRILRETAITDMFIQPAAGDDGGALGAALWAYHEVLGHPRRFAMEHAYWGEAQGQDSVENALRESGLRYNRIENEEALIDRVTDLIVKGKVVGWMQGAFEFGPRALGNRSILADPRREEMKETINRKIKFREPFRPFAPAVLPEAAARFFDLPPGANHLARFMLVVTPVHPMAREQIAATTHVDGSARVQVVPQHTNPLFYNLIQHFGEATGVPVLLNTSFNLKGEPIVNTADDAVSTFMRSDMDALVCTTCLVEKPR